MDDQDVGQNIIENESEPSAFAMIPKMAIMDLDPYELALYSNYKITASEHGKCWKSNKTLATECKMSIRQVQYARDSLEKKGYIVSTVQKDDKGRINSPPDVTIKNVWSENRKRFGKSSTPMHLMHTPLHDVHTPHAPDAPNVYLLESEKKIPATKSRSKSKSSGSYPTSTKRWNREHALRYWQENKSPLDTLATAWGRDLKFCDSMSKFEMVEFIDTYRDLMDSGVGCDKFESLATFTRAKMSWKGAGMRPVEMVKLVTQWRESHVVTPAKPAMTESMIMNAAIFAEGKI